MWVFFKEPRDKKLDSIRCGRRFVSKRVRRGGFFSFFLSQSLPTAGRAPSRKEIVIHYDWLPKGHPPPRKNLCAFPTLQPAPQNYGETYSFFSFSRRWSRSKNKTLLTKAAADCKRLCQLNNQSEFWDYLHKIQRTHLIVIPKNNIHLILAG